MEVIMASRVLLKVAGKEWTYVELETGWRRAQGRGERRRAKLEPMPGELGDLKRGDTFLLNGKYCIYCDNEAYELETGREFVIDPKNHIVGVCKLVLI